jgi:hypothetical protein
MRKRVVILFLAILMGVFTMGCGNIINNGNEFIGKWVNNDRASETTEIKKNGDNFIVDQTAPTFIGKVINNGDKKTREYPAILKEDVLTVNTGAEPIVISYVKEGDYLLIGGHKFIRQK